MEDKEFRIKINAVKRMKKEEKHYIDEISKMKRMISEIQSTDPDNYEIKKKIEILEETENTLIHTTKLSKGHVAKLQSLIQEHLEDGNISQEIIEEINSLE